jgi:hypothetical protein
MVTMFEMLGVLLVAVLVALGLLVLFDRTGRG